MISARRWSARPLSKDPRRPIEGSVCATVWPTRALDSAVRWFDEIYVWTEGFNPSTTQRARIQSTTLEGAFQMLEREQADRVGVTLSFGTVEAGTVRQRRTVPASCRYGRFTRAQPRSQIQPINSAPVCGGVQRARCRIDRQLVNRNGRKSGTRNAPRRCTAGANHHAEIRRSKQIASLRIES